MTSETTQTRLLHPMALFTLVTAGVFMVLTLTLLAIDIYPEPVRSTPTTETPVISPIQDEVPVIVTVETATPTRIVIESIGVDTTITNPDSTDVSVLDRALQSGAVRYPESGLLGESANMLIFGHSSYLPVVKNKAYQAFNELGKVTPGERITVYSDNHMYTYEVSSVRMAQAEDVFVEFTSSVPTLTLATCNTFGAKEDRWVVTATLVSFE